MWLKKYRLELTVFVAGAAGMAFEMLGFGILGPHFGLSLSVSSNIIAFILFALSAGYITGGFLADKNPSEIRLGKIVIGASIYTGVIMGLKEWITEFLLFNIHSSWGGSLVTMVLLFGPISFCLGMILPYAAKLARTEHENNPGKRTGRLYGLSSIGSIAGTFLGGFILIPYTSLPVSLLALSLIMIGIGALFAPINRWKWVALVPVLIIYTLLTTNLEYFKTYGNLRRYIADGSALIDRESLTKLADVNSPYNRIQVYEGKDDISGKPVRLMRVNRELHTGTFLDSNEFVFNYTKFNTLGGHYNPTAKKALLLGGGGYSYAKFFLSDTPLHDVIKEWYLDGKYYSNDNKLSVPVLTTSDPLKQKLNSTLIYVSPNPPQGSEIEGTENSVTAHNQAPGTHIVADQAIINETHMPCENGFIHVHEVSKNGMAGAIISPDYYLPKEVNKAGTVIATSGLLPHGTSSNIDMTLNRPTKDGEAVVIMLHRDNCNGRADLPLVDGYEKIESLDVVEIDPKTTELAQKYFFLNLQDPRLKIYHEDARTFINDTPNKYDIIYFDAFRSFYSLPYQLATRETVQKLYDMLNPGGVLVLNTPSALGGTMGKFFQAEYKTYKSVFPALRVYAVTSSTQQTITQNIVTIAFKSKDNIRTTQNDDALINERLTHLWAEQLDPNIPILTDDFAPVDYYINALRDINVD